MKNTKDTFSVGDKVELAGVEGEISESYNDGSVRVYWPTSDDVNYFYIYGAIFQLLKKVEPKEPPLEERFPIGTEVEVTIRGKVIEHDNDKPLSLALQTTLLDDFNEPFSHWLHRDELANATIISMPE